MPADDDRLLDALADAFRPGRLLPAAPSQAERQLLGRQVAERFGRGGHRRGGVASRIVVISAATVAVGASAAAAATGRIPVPRPVHELAYQLGLPVNSPEVDDLHHALSQLRHAVQQGDRAHVEQFSKVVANDVNQLNGSDRRQLGPQAIATVTAANVAVGNLPPFTGHPPAVLTAPSSPASTVAPPAPTYGPPATFPHPPNTLAAPPPTTPDTTPEPPPHTPTTSTTTPPPTTTTVPPTTTTTTPDQTTTTTTPPDTTTTAPPDTTTTTPGRGSAG